MHQCWPNAERSGVTTRIPRCIAQSRLRASLNHTCRAFSFYKAAGIGSLSPSNESLPTSKALATSAYRFVADKMFDKRDGLYVWTVSRDGSKVSQPGKSIYGQVLLLYAFSQYGITWGDSEAKTKALDAFRAMDRLWCVCV